MASRSPGTSPARASALQRAVRDATDVARVCRDLRRFGKPDIILTFGMGIGDNLLCTTVLRELRLRDAGRIWMATDYPDLFLHNPDPTHLVRASKWLNSYAKRSGIKFVHPLYAQMRPDGESEEPPRRHILTAMCEMAGITGSITRMPYLHLTPEETGAGRLASRPIVLHSSGMGARWPIPTKEWYPERFQAVAAALSKRHTVIQLGAATDPLLSEAIDLRGKTTIRESAAILANAALFIGQVGALMHLARAVNCRAVIVYGGREHPEQSGYGCNANLYTALACAPCWLRERCPLDRECMQRITPEQVIGAAAQQLERYGEPLEVDRDVI